MFIVASVVVVASVGVVVGGDGGGRGRGCGCGSDGDVEPFSTTTVPVCLFDPATFSFRLLVSLLSLMLLPPFRAIFDLWNTNTVFSVVFPRSVPSLPRWCCLLVCVFQLLLGEVPERSVFNQKGFVVSLRPYLALTQAVRQGDLVEFNRIVKEVRFE